MLHMIVNTHGPESCAFRGAEHRDAVVESVAALDALAQDRGARVEGAWASAASHTFFWLIDAPNAHAVHDLLRDAGLIGHTHSTVYAVNELADVMASFPR
jgi:hypothetical protein